MAVRLPGLTQEEYHVSGASVCRHRFNIWKSLGKKIFGWKFKSLTLKNPAIENFFKALRNPKPKNKNLEPGSDLYGVLLIKIWSKLTNLQNFPILKTYPLSVLLSLSVCVWWFEIWWVWNFKWYRYLCGLVQASTSGYPGTDFEPNLRFASPTMIISE